MATREEVESWLLACAGKDRAAFDQLYLHTSAKLFGICLRVLNDRAEAEGALQEIYVKIWQKADTYAANGMSPMTWLITVARNHAIDRLRKRRVTRGAGLEEAEELPSADPGPEALAVKASEARALRSCLDELPEDRAEAVQRAYMLGETYAELAARYEVPLNTMKTWLRRSLLKLRECLSR